MGKVSQYFMEEIERANEISEMQRALGCSLKPTNTKENEDD